LLAGRWAFRAGTHLSGLCAALGAFHVNGRALILSGIDRASSQWNSISEWTDGLSNLHNYPLLDDAIERADDQILHRHGGASDAFEMTYLSEQALLAGLTEGELDQLASLGTTRTYQPGERIITPGEPATSVFFLKSGAVHVRLPSGIRLATVTAGMTFGEMALLEAQRPADIDADAAATALKVPLRDFERFREIILRAMRPPPHEHACRAKSQPFSSMTTLAHLHDCERQARRSHGCSSIRLPRLPHKPVLGEVAEGLAQESSGGARLKRPLARHSELPRERFSPLALSGPDGLSQQCPSLRAKPTSRDPARSSRAVKEYLATLDDTAWGGASDVIPKFVSPSDPAAQWTGLTRDRHSSLTPTII
jgi:hypothetical protein